MSGGGAIIPGADLPEQHVTCEQCGHDRSEHHQANLSDGPLVVMYLLICPTGVFKAKDHDVDGRHVSYRYYRKI